MVDLVMTVKTYPKRRKKQPKPELEAEIALDPIKSYSDPSSFL